MKIIGITGGIGSGKSLVADILREKYGAYTVNTDGLAKEQMEPGGISYPGVVDYFGTGILAEDGSIDRRKLSGIVFEDKEKLLALNRLTHTNVLKEVVKEIEIIRNSGKVPYFIIETALMIESGYASVCDEVWYVQASPEKRRDRLKANRGYTDEKVDSIFASQCKEEDFLKKFSIVIKNDGDIKWLGEQVKRLLSK